MMPSCRRTRLAAAVATLAITGGSFPLAAQLGSRPADQWALTLENGRRLESLEIEAVVEQIGLRPGDMVADVGAGTGIFSVPMARAVRPGGLVMAVEVDAGFLPIIRDRAGQGNVDNIVPVLGKFEDPRIPRGDMDVIFFHDVLHHVAERAAYLQRVASYVKPGGRIVIVDYDMNVPGVPHSNQPEMLISPDQVDGWLRAVGFQLTREVGMFDDKFYVIYTKRG